jgi:hypothetical protein
MLPAMIGSSLELSIYLVFSGRKHQARPQKQDDVDQKDSIQDPKKIDDPRLLRIGRKETRKDDRRLKQVTHVI